MGSVELLKGLKEQAVAKIGAIDAAKQEYVDQVATLDMVEQVVAEEKKLEREAGFEEGLAQSGQAGGSDKLYSDAEMNAEIQPRDAKIAEQKAMLEQKDAELMAAGEKMSALETEKMQLEEKLVAGDAVVVQLTSDLNAARAELSKVNGDLQAKVNEVFAAKMAEVLAKIDEMEAKETEDVEKTKALKDAFAGLVPPVVGQPEPEPVPEPQPEPMPEPEQPVEQPVEEPAEQPAEEQN